MKNLSSNVRMMAAVPLVMLLLLSNLVELKCDEQPKEQLKTSIGNNKTNDHKSNASVLQHDSSDPSEKKTNGTLTESHAVSNVDAKNKGADSNSDKHLDEKTNDKAEGLPTSNADYERLHRNMDINVDESIKGGFYILLALSASAMSFVIFKLYKMRLSRAERKYGVQGDHSTQELTPLPMAIEDINSDDEEDHTLFELNRQQIRIL